MPLTLSPFEQVSEKSVPQSGLSTSSDSGILSVGVTIQSRNALARTFSHYELLELIGEGQFGTVWRANDQRLGRIVALKIPHLAGFDERRQALFLREARAAATLEHPHIVQVYGVEEDGDQIGIVSQFIEGRTLFQMQQAKRPTFMESARIVASISDAVHHAHQAGVIHRDLKPCNILMDADGQPHVSDFGLAKWSGDQTQLTSPGLVLGTPAYMSPEQARGDSNLVDRRSDVYSLGVILYEMLTGKPPFEGNSTLLLHQIQIQEPRSPRKHDETIPQDLETICLKCLAKAPDKRYASARDLELDLQRFLAAEPILARPISTLERRIRWMRRNRAMTTWAAVAILSTFIVIGMSASLLLSASPSPAAVPLLVAPAQPINVSLNTAPTGAKVVFYPLDPMTGEPILAEGIRPKTTSPVTVPVPPGDYLVVATLPGERFHEVYRHVPRDVGIEQRHYAHSMWKIMSPHAIELHPIDIQLSQSDESMLLLGDAQAGQVNSMNQAVRPILLDQFEVTIGEFLSKNKNRLPPSLNGRVELLSHLNFPITGLFFDEAMQYAEQSGKRLPTASEYEFAATNGGTTRFPWGETEPPTDAWKLTPIGKGFDKTLASSPIYGLFSNASEFVHSGGFLYSEEFQTKGEPTKRFLMLAANVHGEIVRGGPTASWTDLGELRSQGAFWRVTTSRNFSSPFVGFRCAKSKTPRL